MNKIPFYRASYGPEEVNAVSKCITRQLVGRGPYTALFEKEFARYLGASYAIAVNSCSSAMHLALAAYGIKSGDEVITTPMTFCATIFAVLYLGAHPVFCDIEPDTLCIDTGKIRNLINEKTKAILPVHYSGRPCNMSVLRAICREYNLFLIEDAAHALPSRWEGKLIGSDYPEVKGVTCFSFQATKNLAIGDGGMLTTHDAALAERIREKSFFGMQKKPLQSENVDESLKYEIMSLGYKYNMTDIEASIGRVQLKKLDDMQKRRLANIRYYDEQLSGIDEIEVPEFDNGEKSSWHLYVIKLKKNRNGTYLRDKLQHFLAENGVQTSLHYLPIYEHVYFKSLNLNKDLSLPVTDDAAKAVISLPVYADLKFEEIDYISDCIKKFFSGGCNGKRSYKKQSY